MALGSGSLSSAYWDSNLGIMIPKVKNFPADGTTKAFITLNYWDSTISREGTIGAVSYFQKRWDVQVQSLKSWLNHEEESN